MQYTDKYHFKLPEEEDFYNIGDFNENTNKVEEELKKGEVLKQQVENTLEKTTETVGNIRAEMQGQLGSLNESITEVAFQLELQNLIDTEQMSSIAVDVIDSANAVKITSGIFSANKVYI